MAPKIKTGNGNHAVKTVKATVTDSKTKETIHEEEGQEKVPVQRPDGPYVSIRYVDSIKLSLNFQSIGLEVGFVEYPIRYSRDKDEMREEIESVAEMVGEMLVEKTIELKGLLAQLAESRKKG